MSSHLIINLFNNLIRLTLTMPLFSHDRMGFDDTVAVLAKDFVWCVMRVYFFCCSSYIFCLINAIYSCRVQVAMNIMDGINGKCIETISILFALASLIMFLHH